MRLLTREGYLIEEQGMTYLADTDPDLALGPLQSAACTYRIAFGPRAGRRARHRDVACLARRGSNTYADTLTRAAIANERLTLNRAGQVVITLKTQAKGVSLFREHPPLQGHRQPSPRLAANERRVFLVVAGRASAEAISTMRSLTAGLSNVRLVPELVPPEETHLYFSAADAAVLLFRDILSSGSVLLAVTFGKPVIAPRLDDIPETLQGADDLLYDPLTGNQGLLDSLSRASVLDLADLAVRTARRKELFQWEPIVRDHARTYRRLLRR